MFYERLKAVCKEKGTTVTKVVKELNMSTGNISKWSNGNIPKSATISALAEYLGVTTDYLLGIDSIKQDSINILDKQVLPLSAKEVDLIIKYRGLDDEGRTMVESMLIQETRRVEKEKAEGVNVG